MVASMAQRALTAERRAKALNLRTRGRSYEEISEALGYASRHAAREDILRAWTARAAERDVEADSYVTAELEKLDMLERAVMGVLERKHYSITPKGTLVWLNPEPNNPFSVEMPLEDDAPILAAAAHMVKIAERRTKLLGLDAPTKKIIEVTNYDGIDSDVKRLVDELAARGQDAVAPGAFAQRVVLDVSVPTGPGSGD